MLHERPASCSVRAALSPAIPAPTIAIRGIVLLLSRSLEMFEHEIVILYHTDRGFDTHAPGSLPFARMLGSYASSLLRDVCEFNMSLARAQHEFGACEASSARWLVGPYEREKTMPVR